VSEPRVLLWDIESSPNLGYIWGRWQQDVLRFEQEYHLLTIAWKWLGDRGVQVAGLCDYPLYAEDPENDYELVRLAHELFCEADIVIAHNGISFDTKKAQARMLVHGFPPPAPFKEVDTLRLARGHFAFNSNRLDDLCRALGLGHKRETGGFDTWLGCIQGDPAAWSKMKRYNKHDVVLLEKLYLRLRPWASRHPNLATIANRPDACPRCNSTKGMVARGYMNYGSTRRRRYQCSNCGAYSSGREVERSEASFL
jgi:RNase_H superfamily